MPSLLGGLRQHRLHEADALHAARRALRRLRRRVGQHGHAAPPHRLRLIGERDRGAGRARVALRVVRTVVADANMSIAVMRPSLRKPTLTRASEARARAADVVLVLARDAHHHRRVGLLREQRRNRHRDGARNLAAEAAAGVLADRARPCPASSPVQRATRRDRLHGALRRAVEIAACRSASRPSPSASRAADGRSTGSRTFRRGRGRPS